MTRKYDESLAAIQEMQQAGTAVCKVEDMEFGRRLAVEKELELPGPDGKVPGAWINAVWDESGAFVLYPTLLGIKGKHRAAAIPSCGLLSSRDHAVVNMVTNRVVRLLGKDETVRWMNLSLYQGAPAKKGITTVAMAASANPILADKAVRDPTLFCTALKRQRFYMFTRSEPEYVPSPNPPVPVVDRGPRSHRDSSSKSGDRDIFNERPTREEQSIAAAAPAAASSRTAALASSATIHTTLGDMHLRLFPQQAPKAVENFIGHARSGYYDGVIFHRVIPKFMVQTGDPLGDGTGGTSIWDHEFEDEFDDDLRHDRYVNERVPGRFERIAQPPSVLAFFLFFPFLQAVYFEYGKRRSEHERIPVLHHYQCHAVARQQTHHLRPPSFGVGDGACDRECEDEQGG